MKLRKIGWFLRIALRYIVRFLIREALEELQEGIIVKVKVEGRVYYIEIKLIPQTGLRLDDKRVLEVD